MDLFGSYYNVSIKPQTEEERRKDYGIIFYTTYSIDEKMMKKALLIPPKAQDKQRLAEIQEEAISLWNKYRKIYDSEAFMSEFPDFWDSYLKLQRFDIEKRKSLFG